MPPFSFCFLFIYIFSHQLQKQKKQDAIGSNDFAGAVSVDFAKSCRSVLGWLCCLCRSIWMVAARMKACLRRRQDLGHTGISPICQSNLWNDTKARFLTTFFFFKKNWIDRCGRGKS